MAQKKSISKSANKRFPRRRFLMVSAALPLLASVPSSGFCANRVLHHWQGILLGAEVRLSLAHHDKSKADHIFALCVREIQRLESVFTLYDQHSELSQLNLYKKLSAPSAEMLEILNISSDVNEATNGAFNVAVKTIEEGRKPVHANPQNINVTKNKIRILDPKTSITLNGIGQGYITDQITKLLKQEGLENVLVELGEARALGHHPDGRPWRLRLSAHDQDVDLVDRAIASSASFSPETGEPHIYNVSGLKVDVPRYVSVLADTAARADAFSTAFISMSREEINQVREKQTDIHKAFVA